MDSIPIRLRKVLDLGLPTDEEVLSRILHLIQGERQSARIASPENLQYPVPVSFIAPTPEMTRDPPGVPTQGVNEIHLTNGKS